MPPSAFNISDDAPLSPIRAVQELKENIGKPKALRASGPVKNKDKISAAAEEVDDMGGLLSKSSSSSKEQTTGTATVKRTGLVKNKDKARIAAATEQAENSQTSNSKEQAATTESAVGDKHGAGEEYTVEQLAATFTTKDWENLYAYVEEIDNCARDGNYAEAWVNWSEKEQNQTAEQWRQYFEKVVRPQWLRDPTSKRQDIKKKVEQRIKETEASSTQSQSQTQEQVDQASPPKVQSSTKDPKHTASNVLSNDAGPLSESTALKRIRGDVDGGAESRQTSRPVKIQKTTSPPAPKAVSPQMKSKDLAPAISAHYSPEPDRFDEISQAGSQDEAESAIAAEEEDERNTPSIHLKGNKDPLFIPEKPEDEEAIGDEEDLEDDQNLESIASSTDLVHTTPLPRPSRIPEASDDELEEDADDDDDDGLPTPRAAKPTNAFDTQAILSPFQSQPYISALPRPPRSSSPVQQPESEASTTESLREFSGYVQNSDPPEPAASQIPQSFARPTSPSPSPTSSASIASDEDPDPPLETEELESFFEQSNVAGFPNDFITSALRRTALRPDLALLVLDAWKYDRPLPNQRGIWSAAEDALVEKWEADEVDDDDDDNGALQELVRKHGVEGWGGIIERARFLSAYRGE